MRGRGFHHAENLFGWRAAALVVNELDSAPHAACEGESTVANQEFAMVEQTAVQQLAQGQRNEESEACPGAGDPPAFREAQPDGAAGVTDHTYSPLAPSTLGDPRERDPLTPRPAYKDAARRYAGLHRESDRIRSARYARPAFGLCLMVMLLLCPTVVLADAIGAVNRARTAYCGLSRTSHPTLTESRKLNDVAQLLARGRSLDGAERRAGYRAARALWIRIDGATDDAAVEQMVRRRFCGQLADPRLRHIGAYRRGKNELWIVVAQPFITPPEQDAAAVRRRVLRLTNQARSHGRTCGWRRFPPAPPLSLASALTRAAQAHSQDMALHDFFSHTGSDGSSPGERVTREGYRWSAVGENIASGVSTPREVVADWLASPHHCANIMTAGFRQMGVAFAVNRESRKVIYWTEDFGTPR